ncbi:putative integral membrane protein (TIGR02206 family) [Paenibacillus shirakamiensis]|uniref:Integral membrane protein (TIGR02206 family) n=1 Tax=Paenibacillus shirakamiensis TaxID=1265935 RepID=A0ABS4JL30_9BACL|nr:TIGR02206 family membrane protein [Paenibacillus shirakamiensis]MBP2002422.1 putative integral membrane protein (TIGR02206 family) [Paenibacillus shirakamiensis]
MQSFFERAPSDSFMAFSTSHLFMLGILLAGAILLYLNRQWLGASSRRRALAKYAFAGVLILCEVSLNVWSIEQGTYSLKETLPLELCSISLYMCVFMLLLRSYRIFQIVYFTGIGGALQALLTPALDYPFPHYRFLEFFIAHMVIILCILYMVWVEHMRPTLRSLGLTMIFLNILLVFISIVNYYTGGNYMFLAHKPLTASLMDVLGPYPWYILSLEGVALVLFFILYLPFALLPTYNKPKRRHSSF